MMRFIKNESIFLLGTFVVTGMIVGASYAQGGGSSAQQSSAAVPQGATTQSQPLQTAQAPQTSQTAQAAGAPAPTITGKPRIQGVGGEEGYDD